MTRDLQAAAMVIRQSTTRCLGDKALDFSITYHLNLILDTLRARNLENFKIEDACMALDQMAERAHEMSRELRTTYENLQKQ